MVELTARVAIESLLRATDDDATPIIRRLARIQARAFLDEAPTPPTLSEDLRETIAQIVQGCCQSMERGMGHCDQYDAADAILAALAQVKAS